MHYLYYLVLFISSDLSAAYYNYFSALTQILHTPCNINENGGIRRFSSPTASQELIMLVPNLHPLPSIHPPCPCTVQSGTSESSGQSSRSLQANFSCKVKLLKHLIYPSNKMILRTQIKIEKDIMKPILI